MALYDNINPNLLGNAATQNEMFDTAFSWEPKRQHHFILQVSAAGVVPQFPKTLLFISTTSSAENDVTSTTSS